MAKHQPTQVLSGNDTHVWVRVWKAGAALPSGRGTAGTPLDPATPCLGTYPEGTVQIPSEDSALGMLFVVAESGNELVAPNRGPVENACANHTESPSADNCVTENLLCLFLNIKMTCL